MKSRLALFLLCFFSISTNLYATKDLSKGFIINNTNDTIYGSIVVKSDIEFLSSIEFTDNDGNTFMLTPKEIKSFYIENDNRLFESKIIHSENVENYFFIRCLIKGNNSLYIIRHRGQSRFFLQKEEKLVELINTAIQKEVNGKTYSTFKYEYVTTIKLEFISDCQEMQFVVNELKFKEVDLISFVEKLNSCNNNGIPFKKYISTNKVIKRNGLNIGFGNHTFFPAAGLSIGVGFTQEIKKPELSRILTISYGVDIEYGRETVDDAILEKGYSVVALPFNVNLELGSFNVKPYFSGGIQVQTYVRKYKPSLWNPSDYHIFSVFPLTAGFGLKTKKVKFMFSYNIYDTRLKFIYYFN